MVSKDEGRSGSSASCGDSARAATDDPRPSPRSAPTIVAGAIILREVMELFGLSAIEVSEHDILRGAALGLG